MSQLAEIRFDQDETKNNYTRDHLVDIQILIGGEYGQITPIIFKLFQISQFS